MFEQQTEETISNFLFWQKLTRSIDKHQPVLGALHDGGDSGGRPVLPPELALDELPLLVEGRQPARLHVNFALHNLKRFKTALSRFQVLETFLSDAEHGAVTKKNEK